LEGAVVEGLGVSEGGGYGDVPNAGVVDGYGGECGGGDEAGENCGQAVAKAGRSDLVEGDFVGDRVRVGEGVVGGVAKG